MKRSHVKLAISLIVLVCGLWLYGLMYILSDDKSSVSVSPGTIVHQSSQVETPFFPMQSLHTSTHLSQGQWTYSPYNAGNKATPSVETASPVHGVYMTSSAQMHSIDGGAYGQAMASSSGSSSRGVSYSGAVTMPSTNFLALASSHPIAQPEATEAPQMARLASGPLHAPGPPNPPGPLPEDNQLVEHPIGDAIWPLLLLAVGYTLINIRFRCKKE